MSNETKIQEVQNYTGSSLLSLECIIAGLANQLKQTQGTSAIEAAQAYAVELAKTHPAGPVSPDIAVITKFFNEHK